MSRRKSVKAKSNAPEPRKRKAIAIRGGYRAFESSRTSGQRGAWKFRRLLPLSETDSGQLYRFLGGQLKRRLRTKKQRFVYASLYIETIGRIYEKRLVVDDPDEKSTQKFNTAVRTTSNDVLLDIQELLEHIQEITFGRKATLVRVDLVLFFGYEVKPSGHYLKTLRIRPLRN